MTSTEDSAIGFLAHVERIYLERGRVNTLLRCRGCGTKFVHLGESMHVYMYLHLLEERDCFNFLVDRCQSVVDEQQQTWNVLRGTICCIETAGPYYVRAVAEDGQPVVLWRTKGEIQSKKGIQGAAEIAENLRVYGRNVGRTHRSRSVGRPSCGEPEFVPTPEYINEQCDMIQDGWTPQERASRIADGNMSAQAIDNLMMRRNNWDRKHAC
jgi:hypothetical protein